MSEKNETPGNRGVLAEQIASLAQNGTVTFYEAVLEAIRLYDLTQQARIAELERAFDRKHGDLIASQAEVDLYVKAANAWKRDHDKCRAQVERLREDRDCKDVAINEIVELNKSSILPISASIHKQIQIIVGKSMGNNRSALAETEAIQ